MARPLRYSEPWQPVEITARTIQGRFLLTPSKRLNALIAGVLAVARERYDVHIYNVVFLSNHFHLLAAAASPRALSSFMGFVMGNVAREAGRLHGWEGPFWARRHRVIPIVDETSLIDRMRYIYENGCKEGLVAHPALWPGLNAADALCRGGAIHGVWVDRSSLYRARRGGRREPTRGAFTERRPLELDPLPCWSGLAPERQREMNAELVAEAAKSAPKRAARRGYRHPKLPRSPHQRPKKLKKGFAPLCHAACKAAKALFREAYRAFVEAYRRASEELRARLPSLGYPPHAQVMAFAVAGLG